MPVKWLTSVYGKIITPQVTAITVVGHYRNSSRAGTAYLHLDCTEHLSSDWPISFIKSLAHLINTYVVAQGEFVELLTDGWIMLL